MVQLRPHKRSAQEAPCPPSSCFHLKTGCGVLSGSDLLFQRGCYMGAKAAQSQLTVVWQAASLLEVCGNAARRYQLDGSNCKPETVFVADVQQRSRSLLDQAKGEEHLPVQKQLLPAMLHGVIKFWLPSDDW